MVGAQAAAPNAVLVRIINGHSALESHPGALLAAAGALAAGRHDQLPQQSAAPGRVWRHTKSGTPPDAMSEGVLYRTGEGQTRTAMATLTIARIPAVMARVPELPGTLDSFFVPTMARTMITNAMISLMPIFM